MSAPADDGEAALRREVEACTAEEEERFRFRQKMRDWRRNGGTPGYVGPRAGRDT